MDGLVSQVRAKASATRERTAGQKHAIIFQQGGSVEILLQDTDRDYMSLRQHLTPDNLAALAAPLAALAKRQRV